MRKAAEYVVLWASVCLAGCADTTGPSVEAFVPADRSRVGGASQIAEHILVHSPHAPKLETYELRFWVVKGRESSVSIDYMEPGADGLALARYRRWGGDDDEGGWGWNNWGKDDGWGDDDVWEHEADEEIGSASADRRFLSLEIPAFALAQRPDGSRVAWGDSVEVTVSVDPQRFLVSLQPSGLTFRRWHPARLTIWYHEANPDYDGDGQDDEIESNRLGLFYQDYGGAWYPCVASHFSDDRRFEGLLHHFSNYAVSW